MNKNFSGCSSSPFVLAIKILHTQSTGVDSGDNHIKSKHQMELNSNKIYDSRMEDELLNVKRVLKPRSASFNLFRFELEIILSLL